VTNQLISAVIAALIRIESAGDPGAVGDCGRAVGVLQMWPCAVAEANRLAGRQLWTLDDRRNPQLSRAMAFMILQHHYRRGHTDAVALACRWRNPYSQCPEWYAAKVRRALGR
jgi:soluble lytic murein transglycosylase-like protein